MIKVCLWTDALPGNSVIKSVNISNKNLPEELHKTTIRKFNKSKIHSFFKENIYVADLSGLKIISKCNKRIHFSLRVFDIFSKYAGVIPLRDKKGLQLPMSF